MRQDPEEPSQSQPYWPPLPPRERRARRGRGGIGLAIAIAVVTAGVAAGATVMLETGSAPAPDSTPSVTTVASAVETGMVDIIAQDGYSGTSDQGTGLVLTSDGLVVTNNHVIAGSTSVRATMIMSGHSYAARILGYDSTHDIALLRLAGATGLRTVLTGDSARVALGERVFSLGNAHGQGGAPAVSAGIITALDQTITPANQVTGATETLHGVIQTSADVSDGESGGALASSSGRVIGMLTASGTGGGNVVGFAIPVNQALRIAAAITAGDNTATVHIGLPAFLGVSVVSSPGSCGEQSVTGPGGGATGGTGPGGGPVSGATGAKICAVYPGTPAAGAGLRAGYVITAVGGQAIGSASALTATTDELRPGTRLTVTYTDNTDRSRTAQLTLITGPAR